MRLADYEIVDTIDSAEAMDHSRFHTARPPARLGLTDPVVTLRVLDQFGSPEEIARVTNELRLLHSLQSSHLVEVLDAGSVDGRMYMATRHYPSGTLDVAGPGLARSARVAIVADAARGAHDMHESGVAHRDINPSNIFVDRMRGRLADLALAQTFDGTTASIGAGPIGSLRFLDPDLVWGGRASRATDVWSLGMTLHHIISEIDSYDGLPTNDLIAAFRHVVQHRPRLDHTLEPELLGVIGHCLAPVEQRFDTALDLAEVLDDVSRQLADAEARSVHGGPDSPTKGTPDG